MQTQQAENITDNYQDDLMNVSTEGLDQYLTFFMAGEEYGVDILCVQEIRGWENATPIPNANNNMRGVINIRGTIVPIIDLRQCFGLPEIEYNELTVVIVFKVETHKGDRIIGAAVDAVSDVYTLDKKGMKPPPDLGESVRSEFVRGLIKVEEKMVIILEIDQLLALEQDHKTHSKSIQ